MFERTRADIMDQVAHLSGRGASWVDEAGRTLADSTVTLATQLTETAGQRANHAADRVAGVVGRWTEQLGDRMIRLGEQVAAPRRDRA